MQLETMGVLVVGHHLVNGKEGTISPGEKADIQVGDIILKINGKPVNEMEEVKKHVLEAGQEEKSLNITIKRGNETMETPLHPEYDTKDDEYKIGLYIRRFCSRNRHLDVLRAKVKKIRGARTRHFRYGYEKTD